MNATRSAATMAILCGLLTACASAPGQPVDPGAEAVDGFDLHEHYDDTPGVVPTDTPEARDAAAVVALEAMTAYVSTDDPEQWFAGIEPHLSPDVTADFAAATPSAIAAATITGNAQSSLTDSAYLATVEVGTDAGPYEVLLHRLDNDDPWLVVSITGPMP